MRVLHVVPSYLPAVRHGGPIFAVHGLARALAARGHEVEVFTTQVHGDGTLEVPAGKPVYLEGVRVRYFPVRPPRRLYYSPAMGAALRREVAGFEVVHLHSLFLWPTWAAARAAERAHVPYLVAPRGMLVRDLFRRRGRLRKHLWLRLIERRTLEQAAGLHLTSEVEAREAGRFGLRLPPLFSVPNGVDPEEFGAPAAADLSKAVRDALARAPLLLFLGRLSWKKGLDRLIEALPQVPEATLVLAGNDEERLWPRLARLVRDRRVGDRVLYVGPVAGPDKAALLRGAALFVLPSHSENFGNAALEAMAVGCPVVVTPEVGLAPMVEAAGAGVVVDGKPRELAAAIAGLLADPHRRGEMSIRAEATAQERFAWPALAAEIERVYEQIRARHPVASMN